MMDGMNAGNEGAATVAFSGNGLRDMARVWARERECPSGFTGVLGYVGGWALNLD
jgi:hypothetical protein